MLRLSPVTSLRPQTWWAIQRWFSSKLEENLCDMLGHINYGGRSWRKSNVGVYIVNDGCLEKGDKNRYIR